MNVRNVELSGLLTQVAYGLPMRCPMTESIPKLVKWTMWYLNNAVKETPLGDQFTNNI